MSRVINDRDQVAKIVVPTIASSTTNPVLGGTISTSTHTVSAKMQAHVLAITVSGSAVGAFYLVINDVNKYTLRVAASGIVRVMFHYNTFTATATQIIKVVAAANLTGQYEACLEIYEEPTTAN